MTFSPLKPSESRKIKATIKQLSEWLPDGWRKHKYHNRRFENGHQCIIVRIDRISYYKDFRSLLEVVDFQMPQSKEELLKIVQK